MPCGSIIITINKMFANINLTARQKKHIGCSGSLYAIILFFGVFMFANSVYADSQYDFYTQSTTTPPKSSLNINSDSNSTFTALYNNFIVFDTDTQSSVCSGDYLNNSNYWNLYSKEVVSIGVAERCGLVYGTHFLLVNRNLGNPELWETTTNLDSFLNSNDSYISSTTPYNNQIIATSSVNSIGVAGFLATKDFNSNSELDVNLKSTGQSFLYSQCADVICSQLGFSRDFVYPLSVQGFFVYSSTTKGLPVGVYTMTMKLLHGTDCFFDYCFSKNSVLTKVITFMVATSTSADLARQRTLNIIDQVSNVSSTTDFSACKIATFDLLPCGADLITYAFVPTSDAISANVQILHDDILIHFPLGYITDFVNIISTTTQGTLAVIDTDIPSGIIGSGSHVHLDVAHSLDYILNATTTSKFSTASTTGATFFDITNDYWTKLVYILAFFYILSRIIGSVLIPNGFSPHGAVADISSVDDSYKLKEWLYKNKK